MTNYYHYTDEKGLNGILESGVIKQSTKLDGGDDVRYGRGVYLTDVSPSSGKREIAITCWGNRASSALIQQGRVDYYIRIRLDKVDRATEKRRVYLYTGNLVLSNYDWGHGKV